MITGGSIIEENILFINNNHYRLYYCAYLTNQWVAYKTERKRIQFEFIYIKEVTLPNNYQVLSSGKEF